LEFADKNGSKDGVAGDSKSKLKPGNLNKLKNLASPNAYVFANNPERMCFFYGKSTGVTEKSEMPSMDLDLKHASFGYLSGNKTFFVEFAHAFFPLVRVGVGLGVSDGDDKTADKDSILTNSQTLTLDACMPLFMWNQSDLFKFRFSFFPKLALGLKAENPIGFQYVDYSPEMDMTLLSFAKNAQIRYSTRIGGISRFSSLGTEEGLSEKPFWYGQFTIALEIDGAIGLNVSGQIMGIGPDLKQPLMISLQFSHKTEEKKNESK
jgi:hypothetical protein